MRIGLLTILLTASTVFATDWPQWRGPNFNGSGDERSLPKSLDPNTLLWKTPLPGPGEATPAVFDGHVYLSGYDKDAKTLFALCIEVTTGKQLWQKTTSTFDKMPPRNLLATPSPAADKSGAVFLYSDGTLVKFDPDGSEVWKRDLAADYGPLKESFRYSSSPLLFENHLYVAVMRSPKLEDNSDYTGPMTSYLLAVDPANGKNIFKVDRPCTKIGNFSDKVNDFGSAYTSPIPVKVNGHYQILLYGGNYLTGHDLETGKELWRYHYMDEEISWGLTVATPVADGNMLYCSFPMGKKAFACDLSKLAANEPPIVWTVNHQVCHVPTPVIVDGYLYWIEEAKKTLTCLDAKTTQEKWVGQLDKSDQFYASITAADGKLYTVNRKGVVTVVVADPKAFRILSTQDFWESPVDSTIAIANGRVYLRTAENLYCFGKQ